jgi:hypothetical protein
MQKMDRLEFDIYHYVDKDYSNDLLTCVRILINGFDLKDLLKSYELPFATLEGAPDIAGGYVDLFPGDLYKKLTVPSTFYSIDGKPAILICSCREEGCWPFIVEIEKQENKVIWKNFHQPHRNSKSHNHWEYDKFGPFEYTKENYEQELKKLEAFATT